MARVLPREGHQQKGIFNGLSLSLVLLFSLIIIVWLVGTLVLLTTSDEDGSDHKAGYVSPQVLLEDNLLSPKELGLSQLKQGRVALPYLNKYESPLLLFTCARGEYLEQTLEKVYKVMSHLCDMGCPIVVSQDGTDSQVQAVIAKYQKKFANVDVPLVHLTHDPLKTNLRGPSAAYKKLAVHYGWALQQVFSGTYMTTGKSYFDKELYPTPRRVVILEEDIEVAPDFFEYMSAMAPFLDDPRSNLLAVSAFNDNGFDGMVQNSTRVLRSDFFPGLGWLINRAVWDELGDRWPDAYWDDWIREPPQRKGRHILRPEISRTFHFGSKGGASVNQFGKQLSNVHLNTDNTVKWRRQDFHSLQDPHLFNLEYWNLIQNANPSASVEDALTIAKQSNVRLEYSNFKNFQAMAKQLLLMTDEKAGVPRTAYKGVVETRPNGGHLLFLVPSPFQSLEEQFITETEE